MTYRQIDCQTDREADREADDSQTDKIRESCRQADRPTDRPIRPTDIFRQTDRSDMQTWHTHTHRHTHTHTHTQSHSHTHTHRFSGLNNYCKRTYLPPDSFLVFHGCCCILILKTLKRVLSDNDPRGQNVYQSHSEQRSKVQSRTLSSRDATSCCFRKRSCA